jgi:sugar phosphate isomerase/epimerase
MRLGGPIFEPLTDPDQWAAAHQRLGYRAAYAPPAEWEAADVIAALRKRDLVLAEVGAWSNPISPDETERKKAIELNFAALARADELGARCCVNIAGSRGTASWMGPHPDNYLPETFDMIVQTVRHIIDSVNPKRTFYTVETMSWITPDSPDDYLRLIKAIDRKAAAVHFDPVNMIISPRIACTTPVFLRECVAKLGPMIRSCHAKDITMGEEPTVHLSECRPGTGLVDYGVFLTELNKLDPDTPLMLEHLATPEEYQAAADYVRSVGARVGVKV